MLTLVIEMLADDRARRIVPDSVLARAILLVGAGRGDEPGAASLRDWTSGRDAASGGDGVSGRDWASGGDAASIDDVRTRLARLNARPLPKLAEALVVTAAIALLAVPTVLIFAPAAALLR